MKYLKITLHDSDFYKELMYLGKYLSDRVEDCLFDAKKIDDNFRRSVINYMLSIYMLSRVFNTGHCDFPDDGKLSNIREYFDKHLQIEIVDKNDVHSDNFETLYVLLNEDCDYLERWLIL